MGICKVAHKEDDPKRPGRFKRYEVGIDYPGKSGPHFKESGPSTPKPVKPKKLRSKTPETDIEKMDEQELAAELIKVHKFYPPNSWLLEELRAELKKRNSEVKDG